MAGLDVLKFDNINVSASPYKLIFKMSGQTVASKKFLKPIDRLALGIMLVLSLLIGILLWSGDRTAPRVRNFSWQNKQVGAEDTAFTLTFSRPMNHDSVEANLKINPPIPGKFSWAGRRMAYTPLFPLPYGSKYQVQLVGATDQFPGQERKGTRLQPFTASFHTRDRAFAYLGVEGEEQGRLVLYNLTAQKKTILTPVDLVVMDFKPYPDGKRILFSAAERKNQEQGLLQQQLYTVTTGISYQSPDKPQVDSEPNGRVDLLLDSKDYQNLKFDLSADGKTIIVQRVNRRNPAEFGLWIIEPDAQPRPMGNQPGGDFLIAPDSASVALAQGQGVAILPLTPSAKPLDFLPKFGTVISFAGDGTAAAMLKFNTDYTRSLFLVTNQGTQRELLRTTGSVLGCQFTPTKETLYCLLTQLIQGEEYQEEPFLAAVDLKGVKAAAETAAKAADEAAKAAKAAAEAAKGDKTDDEVDKIAKAAAEAAKAATEVAEVAKAAGADKTAEATIAAAKAAKAAAEAAKAAEADKTAAEADKATAEAAKAATESANTKPPVKPLVVLPNQRDIQMSLSPDGLALLFDQLVTQPPSAADTLRTDGGEAIAGGVLWLLPIVDATASNASAQVQPEQLLPGFHPRWLP